MRGPMARRLTTNQEILGSIPSVFILLSCWTPGVCLACLCFVTFMTRAGIDAALLKLFFFANSILHLVSSLKASTYRLAAVQTIFHGIEDGTFSLFLRIRQQCQLSLSASRYELKGYRRHLPDAEEEHEQQNRCLHSCWRKLSR
jgi:hypothetical protein